jgi:hypothetical protein
MGQSVVHQWPHEELDMVYFMCSDESKGNLLGFIIYIYIYRYTEYFLFEKTQFFCNPRWNLGKYLVSTQFNTKYLLTQGKPNNIL